MAMIVYVPVSIAVIVSTLVILFVIALMSLQYLMQWLDQNDGYSDIDRDDHHQSQRKSG